MALAATTHHSAQPRAKEGVEGEQYDAPRRQNPPRPGTWAEQLVEPPGTQLGSEHAACPRSLLLSLELPRLTADDALDDTALKISWLAPCWSEGAGGGAEEERRRRSCGKGEEGEEAAGGEGGSGVCGGDAGAQLQGLGWRDAAHLRVRGLVPLVRDASCDLFVFLCRHEEEEEEEAEAMDEAVSAQLPFMTSHYFSSFVGARYSRVLTPRLLVITTIHRFRLAPAVCLIFRSSRQLWRRLPSQSAWVSGCQWFRALTCVSARSSLFQWRQLFSCLCGGK